MTFEVFRSLSIHFIEKDAKKIDVEMKQYIKKKRKQQPSGSGELTVEEKEKFHLCGDFVWYLEKQDGMQAKAIGAWTCPFGHKHINN